MLATSVRTTKPTPAPRWSTAELVTGVAVTAAPARLFAVVVWNADGPPGGPAYFGEALPIVAIRSITRSGFIRPNSGTGSPRYGATPKSMAELGWSVDRDASGVAEELLVIDPESAAELTPLSLLADDPGVVGVRVVLADWPRAEDKERLAAIYHEVARSPHPESPIHSLAFDLVPTVPSPTTVPTTVKPTTTPETSRGSPHPTVPTPPPVARS